MMASLTVLRLSCVVALASLLAHEAWAQEGVTVASAENVAVVGTLGAPSAQYRVGPGDSLNVQVYGEPSLSGTIPVDASGEIDVALVGRVAVGGMNAGEITAMLRERLAAGFLVNPNITVAVSAYRSQPVQVLGAVGKPGLYFLRGPTTVMSVLSEAGGVPPEGVNEIRLTRAGRADAEVLPYDKLVNRAVDDPLVTAGDIVFVPQSTVSVSGSVGKPGEVAYREGITVSQVVASAGGASELANLGRIFILRGDKRIRVNLRKVLNGDAPDVPLEAGDRVYVPESPV